jgi:hypothetical protein
MNTPTAPVAAIDADTARINPNRAWLQDPRSSAVADGLLLFLLGLTAAACLAGSTGLERPLLVLASVCLVPGCAVLTLLRVKDLLEGVMLAAVVGISILTAATLPMIWTGWWHPTEAAAGIAAVAAILLSLDLFRNCSELRLRRDSGGAAWAGETNGGPPTSSEGSPLQQALFALPALASLVIWRLSLSGIDVYHLGSYGLPPALPVSWYLALAIAVAGGVVSITARQTNGLVMAAYILAAGIILFATVPALSPQPHYAWVYKHIGVVRYLEETGKVNLHADIYNRWPGFFSLAAMLSPIAARANPVTYAGWADVFFLALDAGLIAAVVRAVAPNTRIAAGAALLFVVTNWVGQTYFSPQAFGFALALGLLLIMLRHLRTVDGDYADPVYAFFERLGRVPQEMTTAAEDPVWPQWAAIVAALGVFAVIVASHQLTPYLMLASVGLLMLARVIRPWWLLLPMIAMTVGYLAPNLNFVQQHYGLFTSIDPFNNVQGVKVTPNTPVPGKVFITHIQLVLIAVLWTSGLLASVRLLRRGQLVRAVPFLILAACPFIVVFGQSYGGEAPLRILLFSTPWVATLIAWALISLSSGALRIVLTSSLAVLLTALFVPSYLGQEELNVLSRLEVEASEYFYDHARPASVLVLAAPGFPYRYGASYTEFSGPEGDANPNLLTEPAFQSRLLGPAQVPKIIDRIKEYTPYGYVAFTKSETLYSEIFNITPNRALVHLQAAVAHSPRFRLWYHNRDARIYQLISPAPERPAKTR